MSIKELHLGRGGDSNIRGLGRPRKNRSAFEYFCKNAPVYNQVAKGKCTVENDFWCYYMIYTEKLQ